MTLEGINRLEKLVVMPTARYGTSYEHEEGFCLPCDQIEEYNVIFEDKMLVATFWLANNFKDSMVLHVPVDIDIVYYILEQMEIRRFSRLNA